MKYGNIKPVDIADGPGVRVSVFVSGCHIHCPGCQNLEAQDFDYGTEWSNTTLAYVMKLLGKPYIAGLTVLGGEPLEPENIDDVMALCMTAKIEYPDKPLWLYTGHHFEEFKDHPIMKYIDVLVDGPFIASQMDLNLRFRGSRNQRLIDVPASLKSDHWVQWRDTPWENRMRPSPNGEAIRHE